MTGRFSFCKRVITQPASAVMSYSLTNLPPLDGLPLLPDWSLEFANRFACPACFPSALMELPTVSVKDIGRFWSFPT